MKNRRFIQILGSAILVASLGITGCSIPGAQETTEETTTKETTEETTTEEEEDPCCCVVDEDWEDDEMYYSSCYQSTNGELPEQLDYMTLCPDWETIDWDAYPEDMDEMYITDLSVISDEDIRAVAQSYLDDGFNIMDPQIEQELGYAWGDGEYQFTTGFSGYRTVGNMDENINVYKMNEDLFNYFFVEWNGYDVDEVEVTDDGSVIRYSLEDSYVEFNRDTGIGVSFSSWDNTIGIG